MIEGTAIIRRVLPFVSWLKDYRLSFLRADLLAGLTVALVLVPQSMAYAQLAGLPAYYGLYAAFLPPMVASLFGSSRQLATGPVAVVSLMTAATLEPLATAGSEAFVAYALLLALLVGVFQLVLGILRLGAVVNFLSHPVVNGFTNAAALIIATSQLSKIFGVEVDKADHHYQTVARVVVAAFHGTHWPSFGMAVLALCTMIGLKRLNPRIPNVLVAVVLTTVLSWMTGFEEKVTVDLQQIHSPQVAEQIARFNSVVQLKEAVEQHRALSHREWDRLGSSAQGVCDDCHTSREMDGFGAQGSARSADRQATIAYLMLHQKSGLLDQHLEELKSTVASVRKELRDTLLLQPAENGGAGFYVQSNVPADQAKGLRSWSIKIGSSALDPSRLTLKRGGSVVADVPQGLPKLRLPRLDWNLLPTLLAAAIIISLLGFMEAISIAKAMATRTRQKLDPNQELIGQGLANIVGAMTQSYAVSGSFSRSAVNMQAGARTGLSMVFASGLVLVVLLFLAKGLYHLPQAVLAAIIMMAVIGLLNARGFLHAWRTSRFDGAISLLTFACTLFFAPHLEWGIFVGVSLSLGGYLYRTMKPAVVALAPHPNGSMQDMHRHNLKGCRHIAVVSFEGPLNFASTNYLEGEILRRISELSELRHLLLVGNGISEIDASGEETLRHIVEDLRATGCEVSLSGVSDKVKDVLRRSHLYQLIGDDHFLGTREQAIAAIYPSAHLHSTETDCPYLRIMPPVVELSLHPDGSLRNAERHGLKKCRHIAALRFDGPLSFANAAYLEQEVLSLLADRPGLRHVLFVAHGINRMDVMGSKKLQELAERLNRGGFAVSFSGFNEEVLEVLVEAHVLEQLGSENIYPTQVMAIAGIYARAHAGSSESDCPFAGISPRFTELSLHDSGTFRAAESHHLPLCRHIAVLRFDGPLFFFNRKAIQSEFIRWVTKRTTVQSVVFLASAIDDIDLPSSENLRALVESVRDAGCRVTIAGLTDRAFELLGRNGVVDAIGVEAFFPSVKQAIAQLYLDAHADASEEHCPLQGVLPHLIELSLHADGSLRDARRHHLACCDRIVAMRFDGLLTFATLELFEQAVRATLSRHPNARHILFAGHTITKFDTAAIEELPLFFERLRQEGYTLVISGLKDDDLERLRRSGHGECCGAEAIYPTQIQALAAIYRPAHQGSPEAGCPLAGIDQGS